MKTLRFASVRTRLAILFFLALLPIVALQFVEVADHRRLAIESAKTSAEALADLALLREEDVLLETQQNPSYVTKSEREFGARIPEHATYAKLDRNGSVLASYPRPESLGTGNILQKPVFERISQETQGTFKAVGSDCVERMYIFSSPGSSLHRGGTHIVLSIPTKTLFAASERVSGYAVDAIHESFVVKAGTPFLGKPFAPATLARRVRDVLDEP